MVNLHPFLAHFIADHAFTNVYSDKLKEKKEFFYHIFWSVLVILAFTFDTLKLTMGMVMFVFFVVYHLYVDFYRYKNSTGFKKELLFLIIPLLITIPFSRIYSGSYISTVFSFYILGLMISTSFGSFLERSFNIIPDQMKDTVGASERLAIFIFINSGNYLLGFLSALIGYLYRLIFVKERGKEWWFSPIYGIITSFLWFALMNLIFRSMG